MSAQSWAETRRFPSLEVRDTRAYLDEAILREAPPGYRVSQIDITIEAFELASLAPYPIRARGEVPIFVDRVSGNGRSTRIGQFAEGDTILVLADAILDEGPGAASRGFLVALRFGSTAFAGLVRESDVGISEALAELVTGNTMAYLESEGNLLARLIEDLDQQERETFAETPDVLITEFRALGGYSSSGARLKYMNLKAGKTIKYLTAVIRPYNRVGDRITRRQRGGDFTVQIIGPSEPSTEYIYIYENDSLWYTELVDCVRLVSLKAEYTDGTTTTWRRSLDALFEGGRWDNCTDL